MTLRLVDENFEPEQNPEEEEDVDVRELRELLPVLEALAKSR